MRCEHAHSRAEHRLSHDQVAHLRLLEPGESARVQEVFDQMSGHSRFLRFHAATPRLTGQALRYLSAVRPGRHSAVVALLEGRAIGLARWVRLHHEPGTAELAADVGDAYQGRGLGRALVA
ncbi:MAG: GNAT family N-acetyltransferase, partial [Nocardioides sp.]